MPTQTSLSTSQAPPNRPPRARRSSALFEGRRFALLCFAVDVTMLGMAAAAATAGAAAAGVAPGRGPELVAFAALALAMLELQGMYRRRMRRAVLDSLAAIVGAVSVAAMLAVAVTALSAPTADPVPLLVRAWVFALVYVSAGRILLTLLQRGARRRRAVSSPALIVGAGNVGARVARRLEEHPEYGLRPIGFLDADPAPAVHVADRRAPILGAPSDLAEVVESTGAVHVILAFTSASDSTLVPMVRECERLGVEVSVVPRMFDSIGERVSVEHLGGLPLLALRPIDALGWQFLVKHALDRAFAALALVVLAPLLLASAAAVKLSSPGPVFHRLSGVGRDGRIFGQLKFRSMRVGEPDPEDVFRPRAGFAPGGVEGEDRRTSVGRFLRRSAIDELPQLINVLRGEMSLVGPRPERPEFAMAFLRDVERYDDRHRVRAGLTGWAQVHGLRGQQTALADKIEWDNYYIENWSLWLDVKIMLMTVVTFTNSGDQS